MYNYLLYLAAFATAFGLTLYFTPMVKKFAVKCGAIAYPKSRGMHNEPIPQMGGLAIVLGFMISMLIMCIFVEDFRTRQFVGFLAGAALIVILGMLDDIYILNAKLKFAVQIVAALIAIFTGTSVDLWSLPFYDITKHLSVPFTLVWIVGLTNAVNFIDGLDGLAAGVSSIASMCMVALCLISGQDTAVVFTAAIAGSCLGFLPRNFNPAEIIMGDTGATFLGYVLAVSSIIGVYKSYAFLSVVIAVLALALPIMDTAFAVIRRVANGKLPWVADRGHLHHKLIDAGLSPKQAVVILYALSALAGAIAIIIAVDDMTALIVVLCFLLFFLFMLYLYRRRFDK